MRGMRALHVKYRSRHVSHHAEPAQLRSNSTASICCGFVAVALLTAAEGGASTGCSRRGGAKQPRQKYSMTNDHKSEYHKV